MSLITLLGLSDASQLAQLDLTTVDNVRAFLQIPGGDDEQDLVIADLVTRASRLIEQTAGREFAPRPDTVTRQFNYRGGGLIDLAPFDLRGVENITDYADGLTGSPVTLTATDYLLEPASTVHGTYTAVCLPRAGRRRRRVAITGLWGMPDVPADIEDACIKTVALWLRRDVSAFSRTFNLDEGRTERPDALPAAASAAIRPYRAPLVG